MKMEFNTDALAEMGLEAIQYPVPIEKFPQILSNENISKPDLLIWLQQYSSVSPNEWENLEDAMLAIIKMADGDQEAQTAKVAGDTWSFQARTVDLKNEVVSIQREDYLVAAIAGLPEGGLSICHYRPLDAKSIRYILGMALTPQLDGTVCMRPNNFEYAKDCSFSTGNTYASERGEAYLSYWEFGIGLDHKRKPVDGWENQKIFEPLSAHVLAVQVGNYFQLADDEDL